MIAGIPYAGGVCMAVCSDYNSDLFGHIYIVALKVRMDRWFYSRIMWIICANLLV